MRNFKLVFVLIAACVFLTAPPGYGEPGYVITASNNPSGNRLLLFSRQRDGKLDRSRTFGAGGKGVSGFLSNQGLIWLNKVTGEGVVANPGSNTIAAFRVVRKRIRIGDPVSSQGVRPISVTRSANHVYVVNAGSGNSPGNIAGFSISGLALVPINGSLKNLSEANPGPAQIGFSPSGNALVVTERLTDKILSYPFDPATGIAGDPQITSSPGQMPFGFDFSKSGFLIISEAFGGVDSALSSFNVENNGTISLISPSVDAARETDACWVAVTDSGRFAYTTNTNVGTISSFRISTTGELSLLKSRAANRGGFPLDMALSRGSRYLYVLNAGSDAIDAYKVNNSNGKLKYLHSAAVPPGSNGLAGK